MDLKGNEDASFHLESQIIARPRRAVNAGPSGRVLLAGTADEVFFCKPQRLGAASRLRAQQDPFASLPASVWKNARQNGLIMIHKETPSQLSWQTQIVSAKEPGDPQFAGDSCHTADMLAEDTRRENFRFIHFTDCTAAPISSSTH